MRLRLIVVTGLVAVLASSIMYLIDYLIFRDSHQLLIQLVDDLSFIPISVFIVVVVIERLLARQEKLLIRHKLNMVVGVFFSEVGNSLIRKVLHSYERNEDIVKNFSISNSWTREDFNYARAFSATKTEFQMWLLEHIPHIFSVRLLAFSTGRPSIIRSTPR